MSEPELRNLPTTRLQTAAYHKRTHWGDMASLTDSVRVNGVIEPPVVRHLPSEQSPDVVTYEVICGERRRRAASAAGLELIGCIVVHVDTATAIQMQLAENRDREGLHPLDECDYFFELVKLGFDATEIARRFSLKHNQVKRRLKLCARPPRARQMFASGGFDEDGALAIARIDDVTKQNEIVTAVENGALQPEEIVSYCQREHTASLEDVPWRVSDDAYKGGACTECPKRSSVQRDLFGEVRGDRCLDVDCYRDKMDDAWGTVRGDATVKPFDDLDTPSLFIPQSGGRPVVMKSSQMVDADAQCPHLVGHTWAEAIAKSVKPGAEPPQRYAARDQDGRPRFLYREAIAARVVKKGDAASEVAENPPPSGKPDARAESRIRRTIVDQLAVKVADADFDAWGWIVERVIAMSTARAVAGATVQLEDAITELGSAGKDGLVELARKSNRRAKQVALAVLVREEADVVGEIPDSLKILAKHCDVNIAAIEKQVRKAER